MSDDPANPAATQMRRPATVAMRADRTNQRLDRIEHRRHRRDA